MQGRDKFNHTLIFPEPLFLILFAIPSWTFKGYAAFAVLVTLEK
jgi:hypothetical protein